MNKINGINGNKKMNLTHYRQFYSKDYNHSRFLKDVFGTFNYQKVDYINSYNKLIEFKESFQQLPENRIKFATYYKDYLGSEYIVFIWWKINNKPLIFVHKTKQILRKYKFDNKKALAQPYLSTIRRNYLFKTDNLIDLKIYLDKLK